MKIDGECLIELIGSYRNKVQVYRSVRMPQLHTSLHFHLTPIVMINGSSRRDLLLNSQNFCRSIPAGAENPSLSRLCYRRLWPQAAILFHPIPAFLGTTGSRETRRKPVCSVGRCCLVRCAMQASPVATSPEAGGSDP